MRVDRNLVLLLGGDGEGLGGVERHGGVRDDGEQHGGEHKVQVRKVRGHKVQVHRVLGGDKELQGYKGLARDDKLV